MWCFVLDLLFLSVLSCLFEVVRVESDGKVDVAGREGSEMLFGELKSPNDLFVDGEVARFRGHGRRQESRAPRRVEAPQANSQWFSLFCVPFLTKFLARVSFHGHGNFLCPIFLVVFAVAPLLSLNTTEMRKSDPV